MVLFRTGTKVYFINNSDELDWNFIDNFFHDKNINDTPRIEHADILYQYRKDGNIFPVYYEYRKSFISKVVGTYFIIELDPSYTRDNTIPNLKLLNNI